MRNLISIMVLLLTSLLVMGCQASVSTTHDATIYNVDVDCEKTPAHEKCLGGNQNIENGNNGNDLDNKGGGGNVPLLPNYIEVRKFENNYNVVRTNVYGGKHTLRYGHSHNQFNEQLTGRIVIDNLNVVWDSSNEHGNFHKGKVYIGLEGNSELYRFIDSDMEELYTDMVKTLDRERIFLEVGGGSEFTIPNGMHRYTGTNVFAVRGKRTENYWGSEYANGTFNMEANFEDNTASITADTPGRNSMASDEGLDSMSMSGNVLVNTSNGTFSGDSMVVTNSRTNRKFDALINGSFHGDGAIGVTGLYVEKHKDPRFFGTVVGVREDMRNTSM